MSRFLYPQLTAENVIGSLEYGAFLDTTNQTGGSVKAITFNTTEFATSNVSIVNNSEITFTKIGKYNLMFSAELLLTGGVNTDIYIWLRHNNVNVPNSAGKIALGNNNHSTVATWNYFLDVDTNPQQFQLMWYTSNVNASLGIVAEQTTPVAVPAVPSIIMTVNEIGV